MSSGGRLSRSRFRTGGRTTSGRGRGGLRRRRARRASLPPRHPAPRRVHRMCRAGRRAGPGPRRAAVGALPQPPVVADVDAAVDPARHRAAAARPTASRSARTVSLVSQLRPEPRRAVERRTARGPRRRTPQGPPVAGSGRAQRSPGWRWARSPSGPPSSRAIRLPRRVRAIRRRSTPTSSSRALRAVPVRRLHHSQAG